MNTESQSDKLHVYFLPFLAHGHMIPMLDIAKLFASRNLKATIVTTPLNLPLVSRQIKNSKSLGFDIHVQILEFPAAEAGLPEGCEHLDFIRSRKLGWAGFDRLSYATTLLQDPLEKLLKDACPDLLVADQLYAWATDSASKFGIPRIIFHATCFFALCASISVEQNIYKEKENFDSDPTPFIIHDLPDEIMMTGKQLPSFPFPSETVKLFVGGRKAELASFGVIVDSFYELEPAYADHYTNVLGRRAWHIGPVSLINRDFEGKSQRGNKASTDEHECLKWLNSKRSNSVVYVSFGTTTSFSEAQMKEIALALGASRHDFIWVVSRSSEDNENNWLPEGFEEKTKGKGMIIRGWAPQMVILEHEAVGGFVTHCGWNSVLEAVVAGLPMVTCPFGADHFYNEKLVTDVLKIGVSVGIEKWFQNYGVSFKSGTLVEALNQVMEGEEAEKMRKKAKELREMAKKAVEEGGSSYSDITDLIDELKKSKN